MSNLPSTPDAEKALLSCALQWPECLEAIAEHPGGTALFYVPAHVEIFLSMLAIRAQKLKVDSVTLIDRFRQSERLDAVGGALMIAELMDDVPTPKLLPDYLATAYATQKRRALAAGCHRIAFDAMDPDAPIDATIQAADNLVRDLLKTSSNAATRSWTEVLGKTIAQIEAARLAGGKIPGLPTGFEILDERTNGYQSGQLWVLAARPGAGKTALLLNLVENLLGANHPTAIFSAEMYAEELAIRSLSGQTRIDSLRLAKGDFRANDFHRVESAIGHCISWPLWIDDRADMRLVDIQVAARQLAADRGVKVIFVDYLQLVKEPEGSRNREDAVRKLSDGFKQLAKELGITVVCLAQLNRSSERRESKRPDKSDLRDSGAIEQDANVILLLNPLEPDSVEPIIDVELIVAKCRGGKLGPIDMRFDKPTTTFTQAEK
jgi:replicative DNA helicase